MSFFIRGAVPFLLITLWAPMSTSMFSSMISMHFFWYWLGEFGLSSRHFISGDNSPYSRDLFSDQVVIVWGEIECLSLLGYKEKNSSKVHLKGDYILWIWVRPFRRKRIWGRGVGRGQYREAPPGRGAFFWASSVLKDRETCHFRIWQGHKIGCKAEEMAAKAKYMKGC